MTRFKSKSARKSVRKSLRKSLRKSAHKLTCKQRVSQKIAININEGRYANRAQAIAVAYSQIAKQYPHCKRYLNKIDN